MNADTIVVSLGLPALVWWVALSVYREYRKFSADKDRIAELTDQRDQLAGACKSLVGELSHEAARLRLVRIERDGAKERIAVVEARELPILDEIRSRAAAHGNVWGPS